MEHAKLDAIAKDAARLAGRMDAYLDRADAKRKDDLKEFTEPLVTARAKYPNPSGRSSGPSAVVLKSMDPEARLQERLTKMAQNLKAGGR